VTFNAAVLRAAGAPLEIEKLEIRNLGDSDVLVRIKATSLCHTDLEAVGHFPQLGDRTVAAGTMQRPNRD